MATITDVNPLRSRRTGDIPVAISGVNFDTSDLSTDFSGAIFYTDISTGGGSISQAGKLTLAVDTTAGSVAGIRTDHVFGSAFSLGVLFENASYALPSVRSAKIFSLKALNEVDSTTYFEISLEYEDGLGYFLRTRASVANTIEFEKRKAIDPTAVQGLRIIRSESRMIGYVKIGSNEIYVSDYYGFGNFNSVIELSISNSPTAVAEDFAIDVTLYSLKTTISLAHAPLTIESTSDTEITGKTIPSEPISGSIIVATPDGNTEVYTESFAYTEAVGLDREVKNFDLAISIYGYSVMPTRNKLFTSAGGFTWDKDYWINPDKQNNNLYIPSLWDATTSNIPDAYFQSGYSYGDAVKLEAIERFTANGSEKWHAKLNHGGYYVKNVPYYLYSSESIAVQLGTEKTEDGRSIQKLIYPPKVGVPISASTLRVDKMSGLTIDSKRFSKRGKFTGKIQNGVELDTDVVANIDKNKNEFIVRYNSNNRRDNWKIPINLTLSEKASITQGNITYTTKEYTSNFNGYSIEYSDGAVAGEEYVELNNKQIVIYIEDGVSKSEDIVRAFNAVFATEATAEETKFICPAAAGLDGKYFYYSSPANDYYIWFNTGSSIDPLVVDRAGVEVPVTVGMAGWQVAALIQNELNKTGDFKTTVDNEVLKSTCYTEGIVNDVRDINSGIMAEVIIQGSKDIIEAVNNSPALPEITEITCVNGSTLDGRYFRVYSPTTDYYVWYNTGSSTDPDPDTGASTGIEVTINSGDSNDAVATATRNAIVAEVEFSATVRSEVVTIATEIKGESTNVTDGDTGMAFVTVQQGADYTYEDVANPKTMYTTYSFNLPEVPLPEYSVDFSRKDIFVNKKFVAKEYGTGIYDQFYYGQGIEQNNDYAIDYITGAVEINLDQDYVDLGYVSYTFDYPAVVEFNNNYLEDVGSTIVDPAIGDLNDLDIIADSNGEPHQSYILSEFPVLDYSTETYLDTKNFKLYIYDSAENTFDQEWTRVRDISHYGPTDKVYQLNVEKGTLLFGDGISGAIPSKYKRIVASYMKTLRIEYEPASSSDYWHGKNVDLNLGKNNLNSGFLFLSRKDLIPFQVKLNFSTNKITALEFADLVATVTDIDGETIPGIQVSFELLNADSAGLASTTATTNHSGEATVSYLPSGAITDLGTFINLFEPGPDKGTVGDEIDGKYYSSSALLVNNMLISDAVVHDDPENIYIFKIYDDEDGFTPYNNETRTGGTYQVLYRHNTGTGSNEIVKPVAVSGKALIFEESLPQPFNSTEPNYDPDLRGFVVIGKRLIQARARVEVGIDYIDSDIVNLQVEYAPIQKGKWTLPILPTSFDSSEINRATYIMINPPKNEMVFTQSGDTDTITLEHNDVLGYTISVIINSKEAGGWIFDGTVSPNRIIWDSDAVKDGDNVVITYTYETP